MAKSKAGKPMSVEESARRMTALLARKPRARKTRAYLETLPKRKKIVVSPDDYPPVAAASRTEPEPIKASPSKQPAARKDRLRPKAKKVGREPGWEIWRAITDAPPPQESGKARRWKCRSEGRHRRPWSKSSAKLDRTVELTMRQRLLLFVAQRGLCALCGDAMEGTPFSFSLDHVIPRSLDGEDGLGNLVLCHGECNGRKTNDVPTGCEMVALLAVNAILGYHPQVF